MTHPETPFGALDAYVTDYLESYEMLGENEQGMCSCYTPTEQESMLIEDAVNGLLADEGFIDLIAAVHAARQASRAAEGSCLCCGAPAGKHWGNRPGCQQPPTEVERCGIADIDDYPCLKPNGHDGAHDGMPF